MRIFNFLIIMFLSLGILGVFGTVDNSVVTPASAGDKKEQKDWERKDPASKKDTEWEKKYDSQGKMGKGDKSHKKEEEQHSYN